MAYAVPADVEARLGRPLEPDEVAMVQIRLDDVERIIKSRIPDLDAQIIAGTIDESVVVMIEAEAVLRLIRNPEGYTAETDGNYSYQISASVASGRLEILPDEWALLGWRRGAFVIAASLAPYNTTCPPYPWETI